MLGTGLRRVAGVLLLGMTLGCVESEEADMDEVVTFLNSGQILPATLPFSEAVRVGNLLILSGQIGNRPGALELVPGGIAEESRQVMENIRTTLTAHGSGLQDVVKCTVMLADMADWPAFNEIYRGFFTPPFPARSAFGASGLAIGARVEVECLAVIRDSAPPS